MKTLRIYSREDEGDEVNAEETNGSTENSSDEKVDKEDRDISRMVLTSELQELPPLILSEYFSVKVTVQSKMTILEDIQIWLTEEDKTVFRSYPQLGLYTGGGPSKDEIKAQEEKNELKNKYWPTKKSVLLADVVKKLKDKKVINPSWLQYANDLNFFIQYPWGNVCYNQTLKYIKTDLVTKFNKSSSSYNFYRCPWIFQIWAFETMQKLCEMMAKKLALNEKNKNWSRWLHWQNVQNPIGTSFDPCLEAMRSTEERQREYYLRMKRSEECSDDVIDGLTKLLEGDVILCSTADTDERNDKLRSSHIFRDPTTISRSFPASSAHEQMIRSSTPVVWQRQHPMPTSHTTLDPATASRSFPAISTHEHIRASTPKDGQTHGPTPTFSTPVGPQTHSAMPTASTPSLESLMHYIDCRIGEHETYMKSMLANHEAAILSRGVETRYSGGDNFECQQHPSKDERIRDGGEYRHDGVVGMQAGANIEYVKNHEGRPER
ncbi:hypothetical protein TIFTF001_022337 [Ficus carica]|uniref:DUF1985 domain-containing protein n=1 Tax=Ficus carica TaxID=3494 RepID=A0AA88ACD9_FICCA|nr:hypothetical protein TIFTF001_022337 [Ficus carica]